MIGLYGLEIARKAERDYIGEHKFGSNPNLTSGSQSIWTQGGLYPWGEFDAGAVTLYIKSTSTADTSTIKIFGLDTNWELQEETLTLTGTTAVTTVNTYRRIHRMIYDTTALNVGLVTARTVSATGTVVASIEVGTAQTLMAVYTVPKGYTAYLCQSTVGIGKGGDASFRLYTRDNYYGQTSFNIKSDIVLFETTISQDYTIPIRLKQQADLDFRALTTGNNFSATASFDLILDKI